MRSLICFLICLGSIATRGQHLLPLLWKINFGDTTLRQVDTAARPVNLLESWERQGYFARQGVCKLYTDFEVPAGWMDSSFCLQIGLQCDVKSVYVNGILVAGNLPNQFWVNRFAVHKVNLSRRELLPGKQNRITIIADNLSYTGGKSYNRCILTLKDQLLEEKVTVMPDRRDHVYTDEVPTFSIQSVSGGNGDVFVINDFHDTLYRKQLVLKKGVNNLKLPANSALSTPGFYECVVLQHGSGYTGDLQWFAVKPAAVKAATHEPAGFKEYWQKSLQELNNVLPDFKMVKNDSLSKGNRDAYIISFRSVGNIIIRGYYFIPKVKGKHAAILHLPGYGYGFNNLQQFLESKEEVAELALCVRGHGISADVFHPGFGVPGIWGYKLYDKEEIAYRSIYLDCVRAVQFLCQREEIDTARIGVMGGSQGGGLTLATAGLVPDKIKTCAYFDPFPCNIRDQIRIRQICVEELQAYLKYYNNPCSFEQALEVQDLIDTKNFAASIRAKTLYTTGLMDDDCPSRVGFAAYNMISADKEYRVYPNDSHLAESKIYDDMFRFLKRELGF